MEDYEAVRSMLEQAREHGLETEVVAAALQAMSETSDINRACQIALSEWDI